MVPHMINRPPLVITAAQRYLSLVKGESIDSWINIWADDAVVEFPYAPDPNPRRLEGKKAIYEYYKDISPVFELLREKPLVSYLSTDPHVGVFEISLEFFIRSTGKDYIQDYISVVRVSDDGLIVFYREYFDPVRGQKAFHPEG
ncbi:MAG: nuclear transport factor 2 family protein [Methanospirillum sp.]|nr:nuclear transport factor 2 family protein [Methanospirillum sp.]